MEKMAMASETEIKYQDLFFRNRARIFLPKNVKAVPRHTFGASDREVPAHYQRPVYSFGRDDQGRTICINVHYYGFDVESLGRHVSAKVVFQKKIKSGRQFLIINVIREKKTEWLEPRFEVKMGVDVDDISPDDDYEDLVLIPGTEKCLCFKRLG